MSERIKLENSEGESPLLGGPVPSKRAELAVENSAKVRGQTEEEIDRKHYIRPEEEAYEIFGVRKFWKEKGLSVLIESFDFDKAEPAKVISQLMEIREAIAQFNHGKRFLPQGERRGSERRIEEFLTDLKKIADRFLENHFVMSYLAHFSQEIEDNTEERFDFPTIGGIEVNDDHVECTAEDGRKIKVAIQDNALLTKLCKRYLDTLALIETNRGSSAMAGAVDALRPLRFAIYKICTNIDTVNRLGLLKYKKKEEIEEYLLFTGKEFSELVSKEFGIELPSLSTAEQFELLHYLKTSNSPKADRLKTFSHTFGVAGQRTFLSLEYGKELGDDIIALGEKLPKEVAGKVFSKYAEIVDYVSAIESEVGKRTDTTEKVVDHQKLEDRLMRKARGVLVDFAEVVRLAEQAGETISEKEVIERLDLTQKELLLMGELIKQRVIDVEALGETGYDLKGSTKLTNEERAEMLAIYRQNHTTKYRGGHLKYLLKDFENKISAFDGRSESAFHLLRVGGQIGAFVSTREFGDGTLYIDDLETNPSLMGSSVGFELFRKVTDMYPERTLTGYVWAGEANRALIRKYAQAGWIIDEAHPEKLGAGGDQYYKATRPPKIIPTSAEDSVEQIPKAA